MKLVLLVFSFTFLVICGLQAQDEGKIEKRERIERNKNIFIGGGYRLSTILILKNIQQDLILKVDLAND